MNPSVPAVRFVRGPEPGDRPRLVGLLAQILLDQRRREREPQTTAEAKLAGDGKEGGP